MSHILVVDDDESHRTLICDLLEEMGYRTQQAANGREALDLLESTLPAAVLLDLRMPVMSGWGLLDALKKMPRAKNVPIIIISAYGFEWEAELVGASGYVSKPVDLDKVKATVQQIVGPPEAQLMH
ncbi:MAG TPA: response regulator [Myxococcaceae bacterium]|jgi:CheY-like chemotaxis protein|nr:response regulator [Myxococcaceae bacterium]